MLHFILSVVGCAVIGTIVLGGMVRAGMAIQKRKPDTSCCLCGSEDTHECGEDYTCDSCCIVYMESSPALEKWLNKVIAHSIELKRAKEQ